MCSNCFFPFKLTFELCAKKRNLIQYICLKSQASFFPPFIQSKLSTSALFYDNCLLGYNFFFGAACDDCSSCHDIPTKQFCAKKAHAYFNLLTWYVQLSARMGCSHLRDWSVRPEILLFTVFSSRENINKDKHWWCERKVCRTFGHQLCSSARKVSQIQTAVFELHLLFQIDTSHPMSRNTIDTILRKPLQCNSKKPYKGWIIDASHHWGCT